MGKHPRAQNLLHTLWRWFIEPSSHIEEPDKRRQASLLSTFLLSIIIVASVVELATIALVNWRDYTGYRQTFSGIFLLIIIYFISRTKYVPIAARLAVVVASAGVFISGIAEPKGVLGGLLDFIILPLWLGSLYLSLTELIILIVVDLIIMLLLPTLMNQVVSLNYILIGPFSFLITTSVLLLVINHNRNLLEKDRQQQLSEKEMLSSREAARTKALLRVASRLNAQLDLDTLLETLSEETAQVLNTPIALVSLYDKNQNAIKPIKANGLTQEQLQLLPSFPKNKYDLALQSLGNVFALPDLQKIETPSFLDAFQKLNFKSMATATMEYNHELIGNLIAISSGERRNFTEDELLLLKGVADQAALAIVNTRLYKDAQRRLKNLQALRAIDISIAKSNDNLYETLDILLDKIIEQLEVDGALFLFLDKDKNELGYVSSHGLDISLFRDDKVKMGSGLAGLAAQEQKMIYIRDINSDPLAIPLLPLAKQEKFVTYYAVPLITQGEVKGVLEIFHRSHLEENEEWVDFLEALAGQAAIAIKSTTLFDSLQTTNQELSKAYDATIEGWSFALDLRDKETEGHTRRVTELTLELASLFGFSEEELLHVRRGSLLHDIGKMGVPDRILLKEVELTPDEWKQMKQHPVYAYEMLQPIKYLHQAIDIPYCHHEKWDGTGYPRGLKGEEIPLAARIFAIVDVWDAITSDRPYRASWDSERALVHIKEQSGKHFDPYIVEMFTKLIKKKNHQQL